MQKLRTFFTPPVEGADLRAAFVASCLRGALPPVDLRAVCLVRAIVRYHFDLQKNLLTLLINEFNLKMRM